MTTNPLSPDLIAHGATYTPATVAPGQRYWKLIRAAGPLDRGGNPNIYVDVLTFDGRRLAGVPVRFFWGQNGEHEYIAKTELKNPVYDPDQGTNMVMNVAGNAYGVEIASGLPSDRIFGLGLVPFEKHMAYQLVFQEAVADSVPQPPIPVGPPPDKPITPREALGWAKWYIDYATGLMDEGGR